MNDQQFEEKLTSLDSLLSACTHCGLCSEGCATFQATGWEHESPRGRLHLASQFLHGRIHPSSPALSTFDRCLGCRACEPLCPHQVPYHQVRQVVQELRRELPTSPISSMSKKQYKQWIVLASRMANVWWRRYGSKWLSIPPWESKSSGSFLKKRARPKKGQPLLAVCCVQDLFQHDVIEQALAFAERLGNPLGVDRNQPCCGAIFERLVHGGEESICNPQEQRKASTLQRRARDAFLKWIPSQTYFLSMGCQCYVAKHSDTGLDFYAWIEKLLDQQQLTLYLSQAQEVYYQPYCGAVKRGQDPVLRLLQRIEGLTLCEVSPSQVCCGGYCGETLLHPQHSMRMAQLKLSQLPNHATLIVASPDCWSLFKVCSKEHSLTIYYPIQLLAQTHIKSI